MSRNPKKNAVRKSKGKPWKEREILGFSSGDDDEEDFGVTLDRLREDAKLGLPVPKLAPLPPGLSQFDDREQGRNLQQEPAPLPTGASIFKSNVQNTANTNQEEEDDETWITDFFRPNEGNYMEDNIQENAQNQESLQFNWTLEAASDPTVVETEEETAHEDWFLNDVPEPKRKKKPLSNVPKSKIKNVNTMEIEPEDEKKVLGNSFLKERKKKPLNYVTESMIMDENPMGVETEEEDAFKDWIPKMRKHVALSPLSEYKSTEEHPKKVEHDEAKESDVTESMIMDENPMWVETEEEDPFKDWIPKKRKHQALSPIPEYWSTEEHPKKVEHDETKERDGCLMEEGVNKSTGSVYPDHTMVIDPEEVKALDDFILKEGINEPLSDIVEYDLLLSLAADYEKNYDILLKLLTPKSMFEESAVEAKNGEESPLFDKATEKPEEPKQILKQVPTAGGLKIDKEKPSTSKEAIKTLTLASASKEAIKPIPMLGKNIKTIQPMELPKKLVERPKQTPKQVPPAGMRIDDERPSTSKEALANSFKQTLKPGPIVAMNVKKILPIPLEQQAKFKVVFPQLPRSVPSSSVVNLAREVKKPMPGAPTIKRLAENPKKTAKMPSARIRIDGEKPSTSKKTGPGPVLGQSVKNIQPVVVPLELPKPQVELPPLPRSVPAPPPSKDQPQKAVWLQACSSIVAKQLQYLEAKDMIEKKVKAGVPPETTETFAIIDEGITEYTKKQIKILSAKWLEQFGPESMNNLRRSVTILTTQNELDNPLFAKIRIMRRPTKREVLPVDLKYTNIFCTVETNIQMKLRDSVKGLSRALYKDGIDVIQHSFDNIRVSWIWSDGTVMILNGSCQSSLVNVQLKLIPLVGDLNYRNDVNLNINYLRLTSHARYPWAIDLRKFSQAETLSEPIFGQRHAYYVYKGKSGAVAKLYESGEVQVFAMSTDRADELLGRLYNVAVKYRVKKD